MVLGSPTTDFVEGIGCVWAGFGKWGQIQVLPAPPSAGHMATSGTQQEQELGAAPQLQLPAQSLNTQLQLTQHPTHLKSSALTHIDFESTATQLVDVQAPEGKGESDTGGSATTAVPVVSPQQQLPAVETLAAAGWHVYHRGLTTQEWRALGNGQGC